MSDVQVTPQIVAEFIRDRREALKKDWRSCFVSMAFLPDDITRCLMDDHGREIRLGQLADMTDADLVRSPNIGSRSVKIIREYIRVLNGGERDHEL